MLRIDRGLREARSTFILLALTMVALAACAQVQEGAPKLGDPTDPRAQKTFAEALAWEKNGANVFALDAYRKANKQDGGHCTACLSNAYFNANRIGAYKDAEQIARQWLQIAPAEERAPIHWALASALQNQAFNAKKDKDKLFAESCEEFKAALQLKPDLAPVRYHLGISLAWLHRDEEARAEFTAFLDQDHTSPDLRGRADRFVRHVELARAKMAPLFSVATLDGQRISLGNLVGKVVLIDFWATWCESCVEALPHIQSIAKKFEGQPLVVLSVSVDKDEVKWKKFVEKNGMNWLQTRDTVDGRISRAFGVDEIPATFTIDADGVLEDQHVGDASIEPKLKKLVAQTAKPKPAATNGAAN